MVIVLLVLIKGRIGMLMKTKIDIISGFLGSGKTTFIKKMINRRMNLYIHIRLI